MGQKNDDGGGSGISDPKVASLNEALAKKEAAQKKKIKPSQLYDRIVEAMTNENGANKFGVAFPDRYHLWQPTTKNTQILWEMEPGLVVPVDEEAVYESVMKYTGAVCRDYDDYRFVPRQGREAAAYWKAMTPPLPQQPAIIAEKDAQGLAFNRIPFEIPLRDKRWEEEAGDEEAFLGTYGDPDGFAHYSFVEIFTRCSNWKAFAAFIGSLLHPEADREQYLYIHGDGENGKSSIVRLLRRILGAGLHTDDPTLAQSQFWTSSFVGKRLVVFPDTNSPSFPQSGTFKALTGNDPVRIEEKMKPAWSVELQAKFVFMSNERLQISSRRADLRRALYVEIEPIRGRRMASRAYDELLWKDAPFFLSFCDWMYRTLCPDHGDIPVDNSAEGCADDYEERWQFFFDQYFMLPGEKEKAEDEGKPLSERAWVATTGQMQDAFKTDGVRNTRDRNKILDWMKRTHGIEKLKARRGKQTFRGYFGCKRKLSAPVY